MSYFPCLPTFIPTLLEDTAKPLKSLNLDNTIVKLSPQPKASNVDYLERSFEALSQFLTPEKVFTEKTPSIQTVKELIHHMFNSKANDIPEVQIIFDEVFCFALERKKSEARIANNRLLRSFKILANQNFFTAQIDLKYVILLLLKGKTIQTFQIFLLDAFELTWIAFETIDTMQDETDTSKEDLVIKYLQQFKKSYPQTIFLLFQNLFKLKNFDLRYMISNMKRSDVVFIEFAKKRDANSEILQKGLTTLTTSHEELPRIISNSSEEIDKFFESKYGKERFPEAINVAKRLCSMNYRMKRINKRKNKRAIEICKVFNYFALCLSNLFILKRRISKSSQSHVMNFQEFLTDTLKIMQEDSKQ